MKPRLDMDEDNDNDESWHQSSGDEKPKRISNTFKDELAQAAAELLADQNDETKGKYWAPPEGKRQSRRPAHLTASKAQKSKLSNPELSRYDGQQFSPRKSKQPPQKQLNKSQRKKMERKARARARKEEQNALPQNPSGRGHTAAAKPTDSDDSPEARSILVKEDEEQLDAQSLHAAVWARAKATGGNWDITGDWSISCPGLAEFASTPFTMRIFIDSAATGLTGNAPEDNIMVVPRIGDPEPSPEDTLWDTRPYYAQFNFGIISGIMRIFSEPKRSYSSPGTAHWKSSWRGRQVINSEVMLGTEYTIQGISFGDRGTSLQGTFVSEYMATRFEGLKIDEGNARVGSSAAEWDDLADPNAAYWESLPDPMLEFEEDEAILRNEVDHSGDEEAQEEVIEKPERWQDL